MTRKRRNQRIVLNFDGLTDAVTNLTGTLILLVVLVVGVTTEIRPQGYNASPPPSTGEEKPIGPLLRQVEMLRLEIQSVDEQIHKLETELPELRQRIENLRGQDRLADVVADFRRPCASIFSIHCAIRRSPHVQFKGMRG